MCDATFHPAQRKVKMIEGLCGKVKRREVWVCGFSTGRSGNLICIILAPSIKKPSVSLKSIEFGEFGVKSLMMIAETPALVEVVGCL